MNRLHLQVSFLMALSLLAVALQGCGREGMPLKDSLLGHWQDDRGRQYFFDGAFCSLVTRDSETKYLYQMTYERLDRPELIIILFVDGEPSEMADIRFSADRAKMTLIGHGSEEIESECEYVDSKTTP